MSETETRTDRTALGTLLIHIFALGFFILAGLTILSYVAYFSPNPAIPH